MNVKLRMTGSQHDQINTLLRNNPQCKIYGLCGEHSSGSDVYILVHKILGTMPEFKFDEALYKAKKREMTLVRFFPIIGSPLDNVMSKCFSESIPYADIEMLSNGFKGIYWATPDSSATICQFMIVGDDITIAGASKKDSETQAFVQRNIQAFGKGTTRILQNITIGVVGCSGTGSVVVEQLARLGVGKLTLVDPDPVF